MPCKIDRSQLGPYKNPQDLAVASGCTVATVYNCFDSQKPNRPKSKKTKLSEVIRVTIDLASNEAHFPVDPPPSKKIIGLYAHEAILALQRHEPLTAEALSAKVLVDSPDWDSGEFVNHSDLALNFARLANALAWLRHKTSEGKRRAIPLLRQIWRASRNPAAQGEHWAYLRLMVQAQMIGHMGRALNTQREKAKKEVDPEKSNQLDKIRKTAAKWTDRYVEVLRTEKDGYRQDTYGLTLFAHNVGQLAIMGDLEGGFIEAIDVLFDFYGVEHALHFLTYDEPETAAMVARPRVQKYIKLCLPKKTA